MNLKQLVDYRKLCPICGHNITIETDMSIPSIVEETPNGLTITVFETEEPAELNLYFSGSISTNERPFIFSDNHVFRIFNYVPSDQYDSVVLVFRCPQCDSFSYTSNEIIPDHKTNSYTEPTVKYIHWSFTHNNETFHVLNNLRDKKTSVFSKSGNDAKITFIEDMEKLPILEPEKMILYIKKQLIVS